MIRLEPLSRQVAVVMGASSGIGRQTALQMSRQGARLVVSARDEEALETLRAQITAEGGEALAMRADVSVAEEVQAVADAAVGAFGGLDTWVHAAAVAVYGRFEDTTPSEFR
ncbi:MAG TPA: SDR family NAD(P)-dependent oxidoreductase, partial [Acidimicrobiales bacterium]|nr:SDR family NAD(P)-dependent oxidoreductase [Acidimicrobiales bacterium]